jgi:hypothetical protein
MADPADGKSQLCGTGELKLGPRPLGKVPYVVEVSASSGQAALVRFAQKPKARDGQRLHLTLEDGRMLDCRLLDETPYCSVVGDGPYRDRRRRAR